MLPKIVLYSWLPCILVLFAMLPPRRAIIATMLGAWLFLPVYNISIIGLPDLNKMTVSAIGIFAGSVLFDHYKIFRVKYQWFDIPAFVLMVQPTITSYLNGLGIYDGLSNSLDTFFGFGLFYMIGRAYFSELVAIRELAYGILIGGVIYVPFVFWESRMSPQLHRIVYGIDASPFHMAVRMGGFRPSVFMKSGLALGVWMSATAMLGLWMWWTGSLKRVLNMPPLAVVAALMLAFLLTRSAGAFVYFAIGGAILMCVYYTKQRWPLLLLVGSIAIFLLVRGSGSWDAKPIIDLAGRVFGEERAASIEIRVRNDSMMAEKAREQLMFGWGGWGRFRVTDAKGRDVSVTDSMWTIQFGTRGLVGLVCVFGIHLLPILLLIYRFPPRLWQHPLISPTIGLAVLVAMYMLDCLLNWMPNPIFTMTAGAVAGLRMPTPVLIRVPVSNENLSTTKSYVY